MTPERYGIVVSKDVMIPMRDGIRLASDIYRPAAEGEPVEGRYPTIVCRTPYDKTDKRYIEIADFFVPHGYAVVLQDLRDRYRSEGTGDYFHSAAPHNGPDGYDTIEWIATQPFSDGRTGMVGSSYAGITAITAALENPPHLTAIWPDVAPTNNYENQAREGGVMQLHMFWALFIHAQDAQDIAGEPVKQAEVWADFRKLRENLWATPWRKGQFSLRHCPALDQTLEDYVTRGAYDEFWAAKTNDYTRYWDDHGDIPVTISEGWFDPFCGAGGEYYATMAARNRAPQHLVIGPWSHVGMRGGATFTLDVDFGEHSRWGVERYFDEQLAFFDRFLRPERAAEASQVAPVRLFVMGGGSGRRTAAGKLDHGGRWRDEQEWPLSRARTLEWFLHADGSLRLEAPTEGNAERRFTYDPAHPVPTVGGLYVAIGELPPGEPEMEPMWARLLSPVLRLRNLMTPGPADQKESPEFFASTEPFPRLSDRPDVLVYQTSPLSAAVEVTGRIEVELWVTSSARDTDFTAKLIDVHPPNEDYPDGYDMLLNDSVIRCRYREGFDHEVLMEPGTPYRILIRLPPTSNLFDAGHRIRVDVSSSNFPRLERNPNTGEPVGRHTREITAEQAVISDRDHPSKVVLSVVP